LRGRELRCRNFDTTASIYAIQAPREGSSFGRRLPEVNGNAEKLGFPLLFFSFM
jgi:hypothetical protein